MDKVEKEEGGRGGSGRFSCDASPLGLLWRTGHVIDTSISLGALWNGPLTSRSLLDCWVWILITFKRVRRGCSCCHTELVACWCRRARMCGDAASLKEHPGSCIEPIGE